MDKYVEDYRIYLYFELLLSSICYPGCWAAPSNNSSRKIKQTWPNVTFKRIIISRPWNNSCSTGLVKINHYFNLFITVARGFGRYKCTVLFPWAHFYYGSCFNSVVERKCNSRWLGKNIQPNHPMTSLRSNWHENEKETKLWLPKVSVYVSVDKTLCLSAVSKQLFHNGSQNLEKADLCVFTYTMHFIHNWKIFFNYIRFHCDNVISLPCI